MDGVRISDDTLAKVEAANARPDSPLARSPSLASVVHRMAGELRERRRAEQEA